MSARSIKGIVCVCPIKGIVCVCPIKAIVCACPIKGIMCACPISPPASFVVSSWLFVRVRKPFCCSYRGLFILSAKPFNLKCKAFLSLVQSLLVSVLRAFGVSTTGRLLQYKAVITPVLHRSTLSVSPQPSVSIRRSLPPKTGFESLTLAFWAPASRS